MKLKIQRVLMAKCVRNGHQISFRKKKDRTYSPDRSGNPYGARGRQATRPVRLQRRAGRILKEIRKVKLLKTLQLMS